MEVRDDVESFIWWQLKAGNSSFWMDNWTNLGALYFIKGEKAEEEEFEVRSLIDGNVWNNSAIYNLVFDEVASYITRDIKPVTINSNDKSWWTANSSGLLTVKSAYQIMRKRRHKVEYYGALWRNKLPHKVNFCLWKVIHGRISTDDIPIVSRCWCCEGSRVETINHLFLTSPLAHIGCEELLLLVQLLTNGECLYQI